MDAFVIGISEKKFSLFLPRAREYQRKEESIRGKTGVTFDALSASQTAAELTLDVLPHHERTSRLFR
ncbi:MAG: hypothetical protein WBG48_08080 [Pricia sp.]